MKTQHVESLEDMVFKGRNKEYGAYFLKKRYRKYVSVAMLLSLVILAGIVAYPIVSSYVNKGRIIKEVRSVETEILNVAKEELPPPPEPPSPPEELAEKMKFEVPKIVEDTVETGLMTQDELSAKPNIEMPLAEEFTVVEEQKPQVIEEPPKEKEIFTVVEEQPRYPGGGQERIKFLQNNIKYPVEARELGIQGRVFLTFVVEVDGSITDVRVLRGIGGGCDMEAVRVVKSMPRWIPGKQRGIPVRVQFNLPIKFTLQ